MPAATRSRICAAVGAFVFAALPLSALAAQATKTGGPHIVTTEWLAAHLKDADVVVLHVQHDGSFTDGHIPGARPVSYLSLTTKRENLGTELPDAAALRTVFEGLGISDNTLVIAYAHEAPMATRALVTLESIGHTRIALLDGGLAKWNAEKRPLEKASSAPQRGTLSDRPRPEIVVNADWISSRLGKPGIAPIDTRTDKEYIGEGERGGMPSAGHLAGARQLQWEALFQDKEHLQLKPRAELQKLYADRMRSGDTLVTYCWIGYRASATYFVARTLGLPVKFYDGSYQDWLARQLPVTKGTTP